MTRPRNPIETGRPIKRTLYVVTGLYVIVGFVIAAPAAITGDRQGAFLGCLIIMVTLTAAAVVNKVLHLSRGLRLAAQSLDELRERIERIDRAIGESRGDRPNKRRTRSLDLAAVGVGDPEALVAASLDRDAYPRLVTTMEDEPPAESAGSRFAAANDHAPNAAEPVDGLATKNLQGQWNVSLRQGDLIACRKVFAAFVDTVDADTVASMRRQLDRLADQIEKTLRGRFSDAVRAQDFAQLLLVGERICALLPDRPIASEFRRLRPSLLRKYENVAGERPPTRLRVIR